MAEQSDPSKPTTMFSKIERSLGVGSMIFVDYEVLGLQVAGAAIFGILSVYMFFWLRWMSGASSIVVRSPRRSESSNGANGE